MDLYQHTWNSLTGQPQSMSDYKGKVVMVVNTASRSGQRSTALAAQSCRAKILSATGDVKHPKTVCRIDHATLAAISIFYASPCRRHICLCGVASAR